MDINFLYLFTSALTGLSWAKCPPGFCSLDRDGPCNIPADTSCSYCSPYGTCFQDQTADGYYCSCRGDRFGTNCSIVYDPTGRNQCDTDAQCGQGQCNVVFKKCECTAGWHGNWCHLVRRDMVSDDENCCQNGGSLYRQGDIFGCLCACGFYGDRCEKAREEVIKYTNCDTAICSDRGTCPLSSFTNSVVCLCFPNATGDFCQDNLDTSTHSDTNEKCNSLFYSGGKTDATCFNGRAECENGGTCTMDLTGPFCKCPPNYEGQFCESYISQVTEKCESPRYNSAMYIALMTSVPLAVIIIIAALVAVIYSHVRKGRRGGNTGQGEPPVFTVGEPPLYSDVNETSFQNSPPSYEEACEKPPEYSEIAGHLKLDTDHGLIS